MKLYFKPMPWLTAIVAICLTILISLGIWQYQRLQWKTALLAEVEAAVTADPFTSLKALEAAIKARDPVDFRRIQFTETPVAQTPIYAVYSSQKGGIYWDLFRQYSGQPDIFGRYKRVKDDVKPDGTAQVPSQFMADQNIGYVRKVHPMGRIEAMVKSKANPATNRWFKFNQNSDWGEGDVRTSHYIEIVKYESAAGPSLNASNLPLRRPDIRNNHFDYMLTWFGFAFILAIIYLILHRRAGRLKFT